MHSVTQMTNPLYEPIPALREPRTINIQEIKQRLGVSEKMVYRMLNDEQIPAIKAGRKWLISRISYERWEANIGSTSPTPEPPALPR